MLKCVLTVFFIVAATCPQTAFGMNPSTQSPVAGQQLMSSVVAAASLEAFASAVIAAPSPQKEVSVSKDILKNYVGTYQLSPTSNMVITLEGSKLMAQVPGAAKLQLLASSETKFTPKGVDAEIEFVKNETGEISHLLFRQGGNEMKGARISDQAQKEMKLSTETLSRYVGVYRLHRGYDIVITLQGDQLYQKAGRQDLRLSALSETKFVQKQAVSDMTRFAGSGPSAEIEFVRGATGPATDLLMRRGPMPPTKFHRIGDKPVEEKGIEVSPEIMAKYAGSYLLGTNPQTKSPMLLNITFKDGKLTSQALGQPSARLLAENESKFFTNFAEIEFFKDARGTVTHLVNRQMGMGTSAPRVGEGWEFKEVTVPPDVLAKYVGTYRLAPGFDMVISLNGNQLTAQGTNQPAIQLHAQSMTTFYPKEVADLIEFTLDDKGEVTGLINHQMGMDGKAPRVGK